MMMMNIACVRRRVARLLRRRVRVPVRGRGDQCRADQPRWRDGARAPRLRRAQQLGPHRDARVLPDSPATRTTSGCWRCSCSRSCSWRRRATSSSARSPSGSRSAFIFAELAMGAIDLPDLRQLGVGRRLARAARRDLEPRARRGRLRRVRRRARDRRLGGARAGDGARAAHRQVQQGRHAERDPRPQHRLRRDRHADPPVRLDGLQPRLDVRRAPTCASRSST